MNIEVLYDSVSERFVARFANDPNAFEDGSTGAEALGKLVFNNQNVFNVANVRQAQLDFSERDNYFE